MPQSLPLQRRKANRVKSAPTVHSTPCSVAQRATTTPVRNPPPPKRKRPEHERTTASTSAYSKLRRLPRTRSSAHPDSFRSRCERVSTRYGSHHWRPRQLG